MSIPKAIREWAVPALIILTWDAYQVPRLRGPLRDHFQRWIGRQIGGTGLRHLTLGLATTGGANVRDIKLDGSPTLHASYPPLASWTVGALLAAGLPFNLAIRLPTLVSMNLFFIGLGAIARSLWGARAAGFAVAYAAFCPIILFKYGLLCVFEFMALGPLMVAAGLLASPGRSGTVRAAVVALAVIGSLYSWIAWALILPCAAREAILGRRRFGFVLAAASVAIPAAVHLTTMALAIGSVQGLVRELVTFSQQVFRHSAPPVIDNGEPIDHARMLRLLIGRCGEFIGYVPMISVLILLARLAVGWDRARTGFWIPLLLAFGLPLSFVALNIAFNHPFFVGLLVPPLALGAAWVSVGPFEDLDDGRWKGLVAGLIVFLGFAYLDVLPRRWMGKVTVEDIRSEQISELVGRTIRPDDLLIVHPHLAEIKWHRPRGYRVDPARLADDEREARLKPFYFSKTVQAALVAVDTADAARLATRARPGQRVVIVEADEELFPLPEGFRPLPSSIENLIIGIKEPSAPGPKADAETVHGGPADRERGTGKGS